MKYIALLALAKIVPTHRNLVAQYQDMILSSISDQDLSIRMRALDLLSAMVCTIFLFFEPNNVMTPPRSREIIYNQSCSNCCRTSFARTPLLSQRQLNHLRIIFPRLILMELGQSLRQPSFPHIVSLLSSTFSRYAHMIHTTMSLISSGTCLFFWTWLMSHLSKWANRSETN